MGRGIAGAGAERRYLPEVQILTRPFPKTTRAGLIGSPACHVAHGFYCMMGPRTRPALATQFAARADTQGQWEA